jgi:hypothetical protein
VIGVQQISKRGNLAERMAKGKKDVTDRMEALKALKELSKQAPAAQTTP